MKCLILRRTMIYVSLLTVLIMNGQAYASSQWPCPHAAYPLDAVYYDYLLYGTSENSRFNNDERILEADMLEQRGLVREPVTDRAIWNQINLDDHEYYDYWDPQ